MSRYSRKFLMSSLLVLALLFISFSVASVVSHGEELGGSVEEGLLIVPFVNGNHELNGIVDESEFPEVGHLELQDLGLTVMFKHNGSYMFVGLTFSDLGFGGFGIRVVGLEDHVEGEGGEVEFVYFLASVVNNSVNYNVLVSNSEFSDVHANFTDDFNLLIAGSENSSSTNLEFAIPFFSGSEETASDSGHESVTNFLPKVGYLFQFVIVYSANDSFSNVGVSSSGVFSGYVLRDGENPEDILRLFERKPEASNVILIPLLLLAAIGGIVWGYYKITS